MKKSLVYTILFLIGLCFTVITVKYIINYVNRPQISIKICRITEFDSSGLMVEDVNEKKSFYSIGKLNELDIRDEENKQLILSESDVGQLIEVHYNGTFETYPGMFVTIKKIVLLDSKH